MNVRSVKIWRPAQRSHQKALTSQNTFVREWQPDVECGDHPLPLISWTIFLKVVSISGGSSRRHNEVAYRFFSPSGISARRRSRRCCSETDHACLYVSDLGFSFLGIEGSESCSVLRAHCFAFAACGRAGSGRRSREDRMLGTDMAIGSVGECGGGGSDVIMLLGVGGTGSPSVAMSTSWLSSCMLRRICTPDARTVSPPLRRCMRQTCCFSRGAGSCSSSDESDESSNEASTGSIIVRLAVRTSC